MGKFFPKVRHSNRHTMRNDNLKNILILTAVTVILIIATGIVAIFSIRGLNEKIQQTIHTKDVLQLSDELYASVLATESSLRGYIITNDRSFIGDYSRGKEQALRLSDSLRLLTSDNTMQAENTLALKGYINERVMLLDSILASITVNRSLLDSIVTKNVSRGKTLTQKIRSRINVINQHEYSLLEERNRGMNRYLNILPAILLFTTFAGLGAGAITLYSLYQYNTSKKIADEKIAEYQKQLQDQITRLNISNRELEQFAYVASHDLQEPLRKISAFSELLGEQYSGILDDEGKIFLDRINSSSQRMRNLITDLLDYSRVSRPTQTEEVNLNTVVKTVKEDLELVIKEKNAQVHHASLPVVQGNNYEFRQLFQNLISNSLKFSKPGVAPVVSIVADEASAEELNYLHFRNENIKYTAIRFTDNGIGFEPEYAEKIFVIFQRLHGKDSYEGTGIGLAICKKIAEKYGGTIAAKSSPGNGAIFTIVLPAN